MKKIKITIGILTASSFLHIEFVKSLMRLQYPGNAEIRFETMEGYQIPFARNQVVENALKNKSDYIFFLDVDMVFPPNVLIKLLSYKKQIVNALAFRRQYPHFPAVFKWNQENNCYETIHYKQNSGLIECDATGMACILIETSVFKQLERPWYYYKDNLFSSDLTLCSHIKEKNIPIFVDTSTTIGHIGRNVIATEKNYLESKNPESIKKYNRLFLKELYSKQTIKENE